MNIVRNRSFLATVVILALGSLLWLAVRRGTAPLPTFTLPNGGPTVGVLAVTAGTNHVHGHWLARISGSNPVLSRFGQFFGLPLAPTMRTTAEPSVMLWLEPVARLSLPGQGGPSRSWRAALADESGFVSGPQVHLSFWSPESASFQVVPRRSRLLDVRFFEQTTNGSWLAVTNVRVPNPWFGRFPQWQPEPLPATRTNGPLVATLEEFTIGHNHHSTSRTLADGRQSMGWGVVTNGEECGSVVRGRFISPGAPEVSWVIASSEFSDATGNTVREMSQSWMGVNDVRSYRVEPSLWPGEAAWRLRLTLKRDQGIPTNELFVLTGISIPAVDSTNDLGFLATNWAEVKVTFRHLVRRVHAGKNSWSSRDLSELALTHSPLPPGVFFDLMHIRTEGAEKDLEVPSRSSSSSGERTYSIREIPEQARTLVLVFAVQRGRTVEFLVKPELGKPVPQ